jgi:hypothetical protein
VLTPDGQVKSRTIKQIAEQAYGVDISQSNIARRTLNPLQEAGYIEWEHVSGKPNKIETTEKFDADVLIPVLEDLSERTGVARSVLRQSFDEVLTDLDADSTHEKGVALETLAVKTGRLLGLDFAGWRLRGQRTGGSEVDVVMDQAGITFNRWQIQCKNTKSQIRAKQIAREVGIARLIQTNTILMIVRGGVSEDGRRYANRVMNHENIAIMFITDDDIEKIAEDTDHLLTVLRGESDRIAKLKQLDDNDVDPARDATSVSDDAVREALEEYEEKLSEEDQRALDDYF